MPAYVKVAKSSEIQPAQQKRIEPAASKSRLCNIDGTFHAVDDVCTHRGGPLLGRHPVRR